MMLTVFLLAGLAFGFWVFQKVEAEKEALRRHERDSQRYERGRAQMVAIMHEIGDMMEDHYQRSRENHLWQLRKRLETIFDSRDADAEQLAKKALDEFQGNVLSMPFRFETEIKELLDEYRPLCDPFLGSGMSLVLSLQYGRRQDSLHEEGREVIRKLLPRIRQHNDRPLRIFYDL